MTIELFVSDLDGTLLNRYHQSDTFIDETIAQTLAKGKRFAIATGRHLHKNHRLGLSFLHQPIDTICMNGALVYTAEGTILQEIAIDPSVIEQMLALFPTVSFEWITKDGVFVTRSKWQHFRYMIRRCHELRHIAKHLIAAVKGDYHYRTTQLPLSHILKIDVRIEDEKTRQAFRQFLKQHQSLITDAGYKDDIFEITATKANKKEATLALMAHYGLSDDQVAVYGNDRNDVLMLAHFPHSYVPNNAVEVALHASHHTLPAPHFDYAVAQHIRQTLEM